MNFLLDPNVAYLVLLGGLLLAFFAIITPGTGLLEVGALFCIALAGYAVYNLSVNWWALGLIVLSFIPFVYSVRKPKREVFLGLAILLLVLGSVFLFSVDNWKPAVNLVVALIASGLTAAFLWFGVQKSVQAAMARPAHDLGALIGQRGEARTPIHEDGSVFVNGEMWSARSNSAIPAGSYIRVVSREGFILVVEKEQAQ